MNFYQQLRAKNEFEEKNFIGKEPNMYKLHQSRKEWKYSFEDSLDRVLLVVELEFSRILELKLPQNTSNMNTEFAENSKQLYSLFDQPLISLFYCSDIELFLVDYAWWELSICDCSSLGTASRVSPYRSNTGRTTLL